MSKDAANAATGGRLGAAGVVDWISCAASSRVRWIAAYFACADVRVSVGVIGLPVSLMICSAVLSSFASRSVRSRWTMLFAGVYGVPTLADWSSSCLKLAKCVWRVTSDLKPAHRMLIIEVSMSTPAERLCDWKVSCRRIHIADTVLQFQMRDVSEGSNLAPCLLVCAQPALGSLGSPPYPST